MYLIISVDPQVNVSVPTLDDMQEVINVLYPGKFDKRALLELDKHLGIGDRAYIHNTYVIKTSSNPIIELH